ncbi:sugar ABC transporter ATP-binding protein [Oceanobacillus profundus]|uniref:sugar ABC transporter ATP-binding protein n=1 Tax=Oceanobacillus profundus TaxID=372463 RepID=UPI0036411D5A
MKILEAKNVTKRFPGVLALDNIDILFNPGKVHCIIGENGAGKSTLIKVLTGVYSPDEGTINIQGQDVSLDKSIYKKVSYIPQELELFKFMTVAENLFMPFSNATLGKAFNNKQLYKKSAPILKKFQIKAKPDDIVADISISDQQLLQIAQGIVNQESDIILLDEPTTSLTSEDVDKLFNVMNDLKKENKAIVFISHKLDEILTIGDEVTVLRNGKKVAHSDINKVDVSWIVKQMTGRELDDNKTYQPSFPRKEVLLEVNKLTGNNFKDISFGLYKGEILGFSGLVGAGRTEVMQTIFGYLPTYSGKVKVEGKPWKLGDTNYSINNGLIYIPEERKQQGLLLSLSVKENTTISLLDQIINKLVISKNKENAIVNNIIDTYNVKTDSIDKEIKFLSGGNQQKVIIGRALYRKPKVLIFDEPTKGIDIGAKVEIYKIMKELAEEGIGIILISSELEELMKCANRIITLYDGKQVGEYETNNTNNSNIINSIIGVGSEE